MTASLEQVLQNLLKKPCISALMQKNSDKGRAAYEPVQPTEA